MNLLVYIAAGYLALIYMASRVPEGLLDYQLVDFRAELKNRNYSYDQTIRDLTLFYAQAQATIAEISIINQLHGLYTRFALADNKHRFPILFGYLQKYVPQLYEKLLPAAVNASSERELLELSERIKTLLLTEFQAEMPAVNRLLLNPESLPEIRADLGGMQEFVDSVRHSLATQNWFGALFMALALPDICGAVENGRSTGAHYRDWFDRYLRDNYAPPMGQSGLIPSHALAVSFTAQDCWLFRCKALHQGIQQRGEDPSTRIEFSPTAGATIHRSSISGKYWLSVGIFCEDVCRAVEKWLVDVAGDAQIQEELQKLMTI